jgi:hypothetical protein
MVHFADLLTRGARGHFAKSRDTQEGKKVGATLKLRRLDIAREWATALIREETRLLALKSATLATALAAEEEAIKPSEGSCNYR